MCRDCVAAAGEVSGKLVEVDRIEAGAVEEGNEPVVLLVKQASGDEEVGACGVNLRGVILCHGLPHLSHLGLPFRSLSLLRPPSCKVELSSAHELGTADSQATDCLAWFVVRHRRHRIVTPASFVRQALLKVSPSVTS